MIGLVMKLLRDLVDAVLVWLKPKPKHVPPQRPRRGPGPVE